MKKLLMAIFIASSLFASFTTTESKNYIGENVEFLDIAKKYDIHPVTLTVAYLKHFDFVALTIIGARKLNKLDDSLKVAEVKLNRLKNIVKLQQKYLYPMG